MSEKDAVTISIPSDLYNKLKQRIDGKEFDSVASYVLYALEQIVSEPDAKPDVLSKEDEEKIMENLKSLGYA